MTAGVVYRCYNAAVEIINRGKGGRKLPDWWKS